MNDHAYWVPAPGGDRYTITITSPCKDCETPAGVIVALVKSNNAHAFECMDAGYCNRLNLEHEAAFAIMYPHKLFKMFERLICKMFRVKSYYSIPDELWNRINGFDPDEVKDSLFEFFGTTIRRGCRGVDVRGENNGAVI
jgi:hypothetical protein